MSNVNMEGLPPEMQQRIADIIEKAKQTPVVAQQQAAAAVAPQQPQSRPMPVVRQPSLMDHTIALRQEVADMRNEVAAMGQVVEAVGNAVGQLYQMFQSQTTTSSYSAAFQEGHPGTEDISDY